MRPITRYPEGWFGGRLTAVCQRRRENRLRGGV